MAKNFEFDLNKAGVRELLQCSEMATIIQSEVDRVEGNARSSGKNYEGSVITGKNRVVGSVIAADYAARKDNFQNNTLLKVLW